MAGKPVRRAREGAQARGKRRSVAADVATRRAAVERAGVVGAEVAGREVGVAASTVRSWRLRLASERVNAPEPVAEVRETQDPSVGPQERAERRAEASAAAMSESVQELRAAIRRGDAVAARNYAVAAGIMSDKAEKLERLILDVREREPKVEAGQIDLMVKRLRGCLGELGHIADRDPLVLAAIKKWFTGDMPTTVGGRATSDHE